jgi:CheY-like chemotaxis protein
MIRTLIIDDEAHMRNTLRILLGSCGQVVEVVGEACAIKRYLHKEHPCRTGRNAPLSGQYPPHRYSIASHRSADGSGSAHTCDRYADIGIMVIMPHPL